MLLSRSKWVFWLLGALMFLAPLFRSGKIPSALILLEIVAVAILVVLWWTPAESRKLSWGHIAALTGVVILPLLYLIPLPVEIAQMLPGRDVYLDVRLLASGAEALEQREMSLYPRETFAGWLILLLPLATYLAARSLETRQLRSLVTLLFVIAAFQAVLGLVQISAGPDSPLFLGLDWSGGSAVGTYTSRNNYVGLLYMVLMITLALFMATLGRHRARVGQQTLRQRLIYFSTMRGHQAFLFGAFSLLLLLAIVFSRSRAGIGLMMLGVVLASVLFARRIGGRNVFGMTGTVISVVLGLAISVGLAPVLDRFSAKDTVTDGRWTIFDGSFDGIAQFFPVGSGPATFRETFPPFQDLSQGQYIINNAHNDYLEWVYDGGMLAGLLIAAWLLLYILRWVGIWKREKWGEFRFIQVGAGVGMLLMLLHEGVDYNLFVPANMVFFAFFAGLFFHQYDEAEDMPADKQRSATRAHSPVPAERMRPVVRPVYDEHERNPFMD